MIAFAIAARTVAALTATIQQTTNENPKLLGIVIGCLQSIYSTDSDCVSLAKKSI
ncbi:hypothetical protein FRC18_003520 [Serendipita sp. 400]|nr:hypothetical protein FRC18_003520 [Serendipita sp. 400]